MAANPQEPKMNPEQRYTVAETAAKFDISTSALTRWVRRGLIPAPQRDGSKRTYSAETVAKIPAIRAELRDGRIKKLAKAPVLPIPDGRLTVQETARQAGIAVSTLGRLKNNGAIPQPERCGRSLTYSADLVPIIKGIMQELGLAAKRKHSAIMVEIWKDQEYRDLATFGMSKPKKRTKPQVFSPEFIAHQGQLKDPEIQKAAKEGQREFLADQEKYDDWIESLTIGQNKPHVKARKRNKMQKRMADTKARLGKSERILANIKRDEDPATPLRLNLMVLFEKEGFRGKALAALVYPEVRDLEQAKTRLHRMRSRSRKSGRLREITESIEKLSTDARQSLKATASAELRKIAP
jgi:MerR HTH family regulatory protein